MKRLIMLLWCVWIACSASAQSDQEILETMDRMKAWLYEQQRPDGSWELNYYPPGNSDPSSFNHHEGGETAIVVMALLYAGESYQSPAIVRALTYLEGVDMDGTYARSVRAQLYAMLPEEEFAERLEADARWLGEAQLNGVFDYGPVPRENIRSLSRTHFGVLGMWAYTTRGGEIGRSFWESVAAYGLEIQLADGSWNYNSRTSYSADEGFGGMTAAGVTILLIAQQQMLRENAAVGPEVQNAMLRGEGWLDERFALEPFHPRDASFEGHYWVAMERLMFLLGRRELNGLDWYRTGAQRLLDRERGGRIGGRSISSNVVNTSFGLMFLARGRVPVAVNKLAIPEHPWNNRPFDLYYYADGLGQRFQRPVAWQTVSLEEDPLDWRQAPITWLSLDRPPRFTPEQAGAIKRYIDLGGVVWINSERGGIERLAMQWGMQWYPGLSFEPAGEDHPAWGLVREVSLRASRPPMVLSNGARDLMVILPADWGMVFQMGRDARDAVWPMAENLYAAYTQRGDLPPRLSPVVAEPVQTTGDVVVIRGVTAAGLEAADAAIAELPPQRVPRGQTPVEPGIERGLVEPEAWSLFVRRYAAETGDRLTVRVLPVSEVGQETQADAHVLHLAGVSAEALSEEELAAVRAFVERGGTVLVETIGGRGDYTQAMRTQLRGALGLRTQRLSNASPLRELGDQEVAWRPSTALRFSFGPEPRLEEGVLNDRVVVYFSQEDLSLGALRVPHWAVHGYSAETAEALLIRLIESASP